MKKNVRDLNGDQTTSHKSSKIADAASSFVLPPTSGPTFPSLFELAMLAATVFGKPGVIDPEDAVSIGWQIWNRADGQLYLSKTRLEDIQEYQKRYMESGHHHTIIKEQLILYNKLPLFPDRWSFVRLAEHLLPHALEPAQMLREILSLQDNFDINLPLEAFKLEQYAITFVQLSIKKHECEKSEYYSALRRKRKRGNRPKSITESDFFAIFVKELSPWRT